MRLDVRVVFTLSLPWLVQPFSAELMPWLTWDVNLGFEKFPKGSNHVNLNGVLTKSLSNEAVSLKDLNMKFPKGSNHVNLNGVLTKSLSNETVSLKDLNMVERINLGFEKFPKGSNHVNLNGVLTKSLSNEAVSLKDLNMVERNFTPEDHSST
ncbi:hypothetical protein Fot_30226 [Forsythia ovata]|uniref:Uncharacterized protein n=1 Tax=Forsythia ovata TaxID=205694 RepID=A0ABD1TU46_9LAMI